MSAEVLSLVLLAVVLVATVVRPHGVPEVLVAVPAALVLLAARAVTGSDVETETRRLFPVLVFLAAILVLARLCATEGLFEAAGHWMARSSRGLPRLALLRVFGLSAAVTVVLSLDATVVLLTPVVLATAARMRCSPRPHVYAAGHLANSSSLVLPMANLTNLLALAASGLTLVHFAGLMVLPWLAVLIVEYVVFRVFFRRELADPLEPVLVGDRVEAPRFALVVLGATLAAFVVSSFLHVQPYWVAIGSAVVLGTYSLLRGSVRIGTLAKAADLPFLLFVLALAIVVRGVVDNGLGARIDALAPDNTGLVSLLLLTAMGAVLANVVNNLPALLILLPVAATAGPLAVLAVLIGVNVGPNLTYPGSLATLLWRRVLQDRGLRPSLARFTVLGLLTVPANLLVATAALWGAGSLLHA